MWIHGYQQHINVALFKNVIIGFMNYMLCSYPTVPQWTWVENNILIEFQPLDPKITYGQHFRNPVVRAANQFSWVWPILSDYHLMRDFLKQNACDQSFVRLVF